MSHGAEWLLVDEALLMGLTRGLDGELVDPLKTTVVQGERCMTTWVVKKKAPPGGEGAGVCQLRDAGAKALAGAMPPSVSRACRKPT